MRERAVRRLRLRPHGRVRRSRRARRSPSGSRTSTSARGSSTSTARVNFNDLATTDVEGAKAFYGAVFGWGLLDMGGEGGCGRCRATATTWRSSTRAPASASARWARPAASSTPSRACGPIATMASAAWSVTCGVDDADATAAKAEELGGTVVVAPFDAPWVRTSVIADPQGATFTANQFKPENKDLDARPHERRARPRRSAARPRRRAAGRGRCRAGRSSRSW